MKTKLILASAVAALAATTAARAQANSCTWGCHCEGNGCGCNSYGSGSSCDTGGTGCAVTKCDPKSLVLRLAPDGTPVQLASSSAPRPAAGDASATPPVRTRWEYVSRGRSAARSCTGVVVARYFDRTAAASVRRQQRVVAI
jgi:hypothetical protein